jgi:hypothetical protein
VDSCSTCGASVQRYITLGGRIVDLETVAHDDGQYVIEWEDGHCRTRVLSGAQMPSQDAPAFRRHECPPPPPRGPNCTMCGQQMPREIALKLGWTDHPACSPDFRAQLAEERIAGRKRPGSTK